MFEELINKNELIIQLGKDFRKYRKALRLSQKEIQQKTGLSQFTISEFETGKNPGISLLNFCRLLEAVGCLDNLSHIIPEVPEIDLEKEWKKQKRT